MHVQEIWLKDFRSYESVDLEIVEGLCAVVGPNGVGKSNLLEAISYLATLDSFRGAPSDAMVRSGAQSAVVRGSIVSDGREQTVEAELVPNGRNRVLVNKQRLSRSRDLLGALRTTVFSPDDLSLVKGGPGLRRSFLDQLLVSLDVRNDALRSDFERSVRQRNALLKQTRGKLDAAAELTLEVWNAKLVESGEELALRRSALVDQLEPLVTRAYEEVAAERQPVRLIYEASWQGSGLAAALAEVREDELRRGVTLVGPHRDDLVVRLNGLASRTHSSQGEQRSLALALRLAGHRLVTDSIGLSPVLLLDDVFSELDPQRCTALLNSLPSGQTLLSSAGGLPDGVHVDQVLVVEPGRVTPTDSLPRS